MSLSTRRGVMSRFMSLAAASALSLIPSAALALIAQSQVKKVDNSVIDEAVEKEIALVTGGTDDETASTIADRLAAAADVHANYEVALAEALPPAYVWDDMCKVPPTKWVYPGYRQNIRVAGRGSGRQRGLTSRARRRGLHSRRKRK